MRGSPGPSEVSKNVKTNPPLTSIEDSPPTCNPCVPASSYTHAPGHMNLFDSTVSLISGLLTSTSESIFKPPLSQSTSSLMIARGLDVSLKGASLHKITKVCDHKLTMIFFAHLIRGKTSFILLLNVFIRSDNVHFYFANQVGSLLPPPPPPGPPPQVRHSLLPPSPLSSSTSEGQMSQKRLNVGSQAAVLKSTSLLKLSKVSDHILEYWFLFLSKQLAPCKAMCMLF